MKKTILWCTLIFLLILASLRLISPPPQPFTDALKVIQTVTQTHSDHRLLTLTVSNTTQKGMVFLDCPPTFRLKSGWSKVSIPFGVPMTNLAPAQAITFNVRVEGIEGEPRIPIIWSYQYSSRISRFRQISQDLMGFLFSENPGGTGAIYTNYPSRLD